MTNGLSLPSRERGLKSDTSVLKDKTLKPSLPSRERGLKYCNSGGVKSLSDVAPFAGAWIEIHNGIGTAC